MRLTGAAQVALLNDIPCRFDEAGNSFRYITSESAGQLHSGRCSRCGRDLKADI